MSAWLEKAVGCKIGTVPMVVHVHGKDAMRVGNWIRVKMRQGANWQRVYVNRIDADGHFQADQ